MIIKGLRLLKLVNYIQLRKVDVLFFYLKYHPKREVLNLKVDWNYLKSRAYFFS
jgi:hypothetical protein